jgi:2-polyprenyl-3-methyl-5-hydroxy-6-metoxy-1,4-benzoquinol methylase
MAVGAAIRRLFGPYESQISDAYRSIYLRIDDLVEHIKEWKPEAKRILEIGCGEGAVTERLVIAYPGAEITAIDITPRVGRMYKGPRDCARFMQTTVQDIAAAQPGQFDFVVLADVLHHVPIFMRAELLEAARQALAPDGVFVFKDWERTLTPIHWLCYASDRWLTGDRISYMSADEMHAQLAKTFGEQAVKATARIAPWRNNLAFMVRL